jgi:hypothetical protein
VYAHEVARVERKRRVDRFVKRYSIDAAGRLEAKESEGMKGLHPVIVAVTGNDGSSRVTTAKGNAALNVAAEKRGGAYVVPPPLPEVLNPVPRTPAIFQPGTGPSTTTSRLAPARCSAANTSPGSLNTSGR